MRKNDEEIYEYVSEEMEGSNEEHDEKNKKWVQLNKKESKTDDREKRNVTFIIVSISFLIFLIAAIVSIHGTKKMNAVKEKTSITEGKEDGTITEVTNSVMKYEEEGMLDDSKGYWAGYDFLNVREDIVTLYKADLITYEQLQEYVEAYLNIVNSIQNKEDLSLTTIENYNQAIKKIDLINYDTYRIKKSKTFIGNFQEYMQEFFYENIVAYYHNLKQIPDEKYNALKIIFSNNRRDNVERIVDYAEELIEKYVGNSDEIFASTEWRRIMSVEDFLNEW